MIVIESDQSSMSAIKSKTEAEEEFLILDQELRKF